MKFRILGPLEVGGPNETIDIGGPRQQVVLAMLLLEANRVVPTSRLIDAVWGDNPPPTARSQIQICVSGLRRALAKVVTDEGIITRAPGYLLRIEESELDAKRFEQLANEGMTAASEHRIEYAVQRLREGLALWRGTPLEGLRSDLVAMGATRLNERRLSVLEECIGYELTLGLHQQVIGELAELVAENPLRERLWAHYMNALYQAGRQAEALAVYRRARRTFIEELGLEPGEELRALEKAILSGDPGLGRPHLMSRPSLVTTSSPPAPPRPRQLPADVADFASREAVLEQMRRQLTADTGEDGEPRPVKIVVITGRGGIGKTALAIHLAHQLQDEFPDGQLYAELHGGTGEPADPAHMLERFLRAFGVTGAALPASLEERAELYRSRLADRRVLIVLDDAATESQVLPLLPGSSSCAVIITSRTRLTVFPGVQHVEVGVLGAESATELLTKVLGTARVQQEPAAVRELIELCGGLPLALRIAAARLAARPHWPIWQLVDRLADEQRRLDELVHGELGMRASLQLTYESLTPQARRLFRRLSLLETPEFPSWVSAPLLGIDLTEAEDHLESLVDAHLLDATGGGAGAPPRFQFHDLVRVFARERLQAEETPQEQEEALRRALGAWLFLAEEAYNRECGVGTTLHGNALRWSLPPTLVSRLVASPYEWFERERTALVSAIRQAARHGWDELCWDLAVTSVLLFELGTYFSDWQETHQLALTAVRRAGNRRGEAAVLYSLAGLAIFQRRLDEALHHLEPAMRTFLEIGDEHGWALAAQDVAFVHRVRGHLDQALELYEQVATTLRRVGNRLHLAYALHGMAKIYIERHEYRKAQMYLEEARMLSSVAGIYRLRAQLTHRLGEIALLQGDVQSAERRYQTVLELTRAAHDRVGEAYALYGLATVQVQRRMWEAAEQSLQQGMELAHDVGDRLIRARMMLSMAQVCLARRQTTEAIGIFRRALEEFRELEVPLQEVEALEHLGKALYQIGHYDGAYQTWNEAFKVLTRVDKVAAEAASVRLRGYLHDLSTVWQRQLTG